MPEVENLNKLKDLLDPENEEEFSHERIIEKISLPEETISQYSLESNIISRYEVDFDDGRLSIKARIKPTEFKPKLASEKDFVQMFSSIYETIYRTVEDSIDSRSEDLEELEINIEGSLQSCYIIESSEIGEISLQRESSVKKDYLSPYSLFNTTENYTEHLMKNLGQMEKKN